MSRFTLTAAALAAALTLATAACGGDSDPSGPSPAATGTVRLLNESNAEIVKVNISPCTDATWGANRLGAAETIEPGELRTWSVEADCYDIRASTASKSAYWYDRELGAGETLSLALSAAANDLVDVAPGTAADLKAR
jgi:hypothetical protein